jgi:hypothetical protein
MAVHKRKWKSAQGVQTNWYYVFDAPGSTVKTALSGLLKEFFTESWSESARAQDAAALPRENTSTPT